MREDWNKICLKWHLWWIVIKSEILAPAKSEVNLEDDRHLSVDNWSQQFLISWLNVLRFT
jgi:hypothetical protein